MVDTVASNVQYLILPKFDISSDHICQFVGQLHQRHVGHVSNILDIYFIECLVFFVGVIVSEVLFELF